ncbi:MAG: 50S ribosomal protein L13 [Candidatus Parvarchaeota archaeon]|nr:50S ribosomal protein L13 [Candidatus Parvarchaeota archaeon]
MIIDGKDAVLGRLASYAAKAANEGEEVIVVNAGEIIITGNKNAVMKDFADRLQIGTASKGPFINRTVEGLVRRAIRGMVKRQIAQGRDAFKRIKVFGGMPEEYRGKELIQVAKLPESSTVHRVKISEISKMLKGI